MVRVIHTIDNVRGLIKGIKGLITDMSFAWIQDKVMLAFIDTTGAFYVYEITYTPGDHDLGWVPTFGC